MEGIVFNIQRMSLGDGPGMRTTVFLKGCPLRCVWCHNPESYRNSPELLYRQNRCKSCGHCAEICSQHTLTDGVHHFRRSGCRSCFACANACPAQALEGCGTVMETSEVMKHILRDRRMCQATGGGVTFSGGEPTAQFDFLLDLIQRCKAEEIHVCLETCGFTSGENMKALAGLVDLFLFDIKETDPVKHQQFTGVDSSLILSNLRLLESLGVPAVLRCPVIPGYNDRADHFRQLGNLADSLSNVTEIHLEPYHALGEDKQAALGKNPVSIPQPTDETIADWLNHLQSCTGKTVKRA